MVSRWRPGDIIVLRGVLKGKLWFAHPAYLVSDSPELVAFYWPAGTPTHSPLKRPTVRDELDNRIELGLRFWTDNDILSLNPPGAGFSIELMWVAGTHQLRCWYVHLQESLRHSQIGYDTMDQILDIVISPDRSHWHWKDEDEFDEARCMGLYSREKFHAIRAEGEKVIQMMHENATPFCDGWENWLPPSEWTIPQFPDGWEVFPL